ncbi:hypothetical protein [Bilophila wadsworthia]|uniref:hypothetical protein n=1 Tax=Bilophila wadsworthia TaxID=35833 RepID=UPI0039905D95
MVPTLASASLASPSWRFMLATLTLHGITPAYGSWRTTRHRLFDLPVPDSRQPLIIPTAIITVRGFGKLIKFPQQSCSVSSPGLPLLGVYPPRSNMFDVDGPVIGVIAFLMRFADFPVAPSSSVTCSARSLSTVSPGVIYKGDMPLTEYPSARPSPSSCSRFPPARSRPDAAPALASRRK